MKFTNLSDGTSTCRIMEMREDKQLANFEDDFDDAGCKEINRLLVCHFSYEVLPIIDEYNRLRQNIIGLERK